MIIALDVDGVVADLHVEWLRRYNRDFDDDLTTADVTAWSIQDFVKPEAKDRIFDYLGEPDLYDRVPPVSGAQWGVKTLRGWGHRVFFATSCVQGMTDPKWQWLIKNGFFVKPYAYSQADLVMVSDKTLLNADLLIDDRDRHVEEWIDTGRRAVIFTQPYNTGMEERLPSNRSLWFTRCDNWIEIINHVGSLEAA